MLSLRNSFWDFPDFPEYFAVKNSSLPTYEASAEENQIVLKVDLPGVEATDLAIETKKSTVYLKYKREGKDLSATFRIDSRYDLGKLDASYKNGRLVCSAPLKENEVAVAIPVRI
jgi:HSP20 family molecular chaperone IbpA